VLQETTYSCATATRKTNSQPPLLQATYHTPLCCWSLLMYRSQGLASFKSFLLTFSPSSWFLYKLHTGLTAENRVPLCCCGGYW